MPSGVQGVGSEGWAGFITTALAPNLGKIAPLQGWDGLNLFLLVCAATARGLFSDLAGGSGIFSFVNNNYRNYNRKVRSYTIGPQSTRTPNDDSVMFIRKSRYVLKLQFRT